MVTKTIKVENPHGLHLRVAGEIVRLTKTSGSKVRIARPTGSAADGDSVLDLLLLEANPGSEISIHVDGPGASVVADQISELFSEGGGI